MGKGKTHRNAQKFTEFDQKYAEIYKKCVFLCTFSPFFVPGFREIVSELVDFGQRNSSDVVGRMYLECHSSSGIGCSEVVEIMVVVVQVRTGIGGEG